MIGTHDPRGLTLLLFLLAATTAGCNPAPNADSPQGEGSGAPEGEPSDSEEVARPSPRGPPRAVRVTIAELPRAKEAAVAFIGFDPDQMDGPWPRKGEAPRYHVVSAIMPLTAQLDFEAELVGPAIHIAILDLNGNGRPNEGELISASVEVPAEPGAEPPVFPLATAFDEKGTPRPSSETPTPAAGADPTVMANPAKLQRSLVVDSTVRPPFLKKGRLLVVGMPPAANGRFRGPLYDRPNFLWASERVSLDWPVTVAADFPPSGDLLVVLDLDGGGLPSLGDLASAPLLGFTAPADGTVVTVQLTGPLVEEGEGGK